MASTYSDLKIQLMQTGENTGTWGNVTNANLTALEEAIAESVDVSFTGADVTLTLTNSNASQSARYLRLRCTGTTGGARSLILGSGCQIEKLYLVSNTCADAITVKNTTGNGIAVPAGKTMYVYNDGTDVVDAVTHLTSLTLGSALPVASGGTGSTTGTFSGANITSINANNIATGTLAVARGGTGATTLNSEAVVIGNATSPVKFVEPGTNGNVLTSNGTAWVSQAGGGGGGGGTVTSVGTGPGLINGISLTGGPITTSGTISLGGEINVSTITTGTLALARGGTGANDASGARSNLNLGSLATANSVDLSNQVSNVLPATNGGTGVNSAGISGNLLVSNGSAWVSTVPYGITHSYFVIPTSSSQTVNFPLNATGLWQVIADFRAGVDDAGTYDFTTSVSVTALGSTTTPGIRFQRSGGAGYGRFIYGTNIGSMTINVTSPALTPITVGVLNDPQSGLMIPGSFGLIITCVKIS